MNLRMCAALLASVGAGMGTAAADWAPRGIGGGGALFNPSFSPHDEQMFVSADMGELFRSEDRGRSWQVVPWWQTQAFVQTSVRYTSDPDRLYALLWDYGADVGAPGRSDDAGMTWTRASEEAWPPDRLAQRIYAHPSRADMLLVATENAVYLSSDAGATFRVVYEPAGAASLWVAGAFFDDERIYLGTEAGVFVLDTPDPDAVFVQVDAGGFPSGAMLAEITGAREGNRVRLLAITSDASLYLDNGDPYYYEDSVWGAFQGVYALDLQDGAPPPAWQPRNTGFQQGPFNPNGCPGSGSRDDRPTHIAMATDDIDVAYAGGYASPCLGEDVRVYRTLDGGSSWHAAIEIGATQNVATGWMGFGSGDRNQTYDAPLRGIAVHPFDADLVAITGNGFIHLTQNGTDPQGADGADGIVWRQAYTHPETSNPPGQPTPLKRAYASAGLENTSVWDLAWADEDRLFAAFTDIRGIRSEDGGHAWSFDHDFGGLARNSMYRVTRDATMPQGTLYAAISGVHDLYQSHYSRDSFVNVTSAGRTGLVVRSVDAGRHWELVKDFGRQVVWLEIDPELPDRAAVSVVYYDPASALETGGIYLTNDLSAGQAATWTRLPDPPRTQGHPFNVRFLPAGSGLVASYSVRRQNNGAYTDSAGVFFKPTLDAQANWADRSDPAMHYWTKDVTLDPHDPTGSTWFAAVFSNSNQPTAGGIYKTTDRGLNWVRIFGPASAESFAVDPADPDVAYVSTLSQGLWRTASLRAPFPAFSADQTYPFAHPMRVRFSPDGRPWVLSFGNGMREWQAGGDADLLFGDGFESN